MGIGMRHKETKIIGITGSIATGKSTASQILKNKGYIIVDADKLARDVVEKNKPAYLEIVDFFGEGILDESKNIDRKKLGSIIFKDENLRKKLNSITHPYIFEKIVEEVERYKGKESIIFLDIPLLIEGLGSIKKYNIKLDEIWLIYIDTQTQLERLMARDLIDKNTALSKINSQMSIEAKKAYATRIFDNRGSVEELEKQLDKAVEEII